MNSSKLPSKVVQQAQWKQTNPTDQLIANLGAINGLVDNLKCNDIYPDEASLVRGIDNIIRRLQECQELTKLLPKSEWPIGDIDLSKCQQCGEFFEFDHKCED